MTDDAFPDRGAGFVIAMPAVEHAIDGVKERRGAVVEQMALAAAFGDRRLEAALQGFAALPARRLIAERPAEDFLSEGDDLLQEP